MKRRLSFGRMSGSSPFSSIKDSDHLEHSYASDVEQRGDGARSSPPVPPSLAPPAPSHTSLHSPQASPNRRRSMTVPIKLALPSDSGGGDSFATSRDISPSTTSIASSTSAVSVASRKSTRFVVSKISEDSIKDGSALIYPGRVSAGSSLAGSPESARAKSPLVTQGELRMISPSLEIQGLITKAPLLAFSSRSTSMTGTSTLSRGPSRDQTDMPQSTSPVSANAVPEHEPFVTLGVCAMAKKAKSKYMTEILTRITQEFDQIKPLVFEENQILNDPVEKWPVVDALISFQSERFPLEKAISYAKLRKPFLVNDLEMQFIIKDRRRVYELLRQQGIDLPRYGVLDRDSGNPDDAMIEESEDYVVVNGHTFNKPFVEKPICADDHNVYIYYPISAGGGSQRLFRKIASRSSVYSNESKVRKTGSFIYEEFMPTDGTDVKVYTVGPEYAHAEARKSPALDGVVERDKEGKEIRFPVILNNIEKLIARRVCMAFKQTVCGFDLLRASGRSYVCDVNGFSFVKNSMIYYNDCAKIIANNILRRLAPQLHIQWSMPWQLGDPPIVTTTRGKEMELRCVVAVIRHGDRTPKQKMKMEIRHPVFFNVYAKFGGKFEAEEREIKLKKPNQLQEILDIVRGLLCHHADEPEVKDKKLKLEQLKSVLEMYGHFSGINRKIQIKYQLTSRTESPCRIESQGSCDMDTDLPPGSLVLIMKWGGELTPLGRHQSEQLGQMFRCMYPGSEEFSRKKGHGLLRLHSTFRHDLKIYASDEGRVQTTAAAFAKGFLALEGELTPILVQMVKSADTNGLLDNDLDARDHENAVKKRLKNIMQQDHDFTTEDLQTLNPTNSSAVQASMEAVKNPVKACRQMHEYIGELNSSLREKAASNDAEHKVAWVPFHDQFLFRVAVQCKRNEPYLPPQPQSYGLLSFRKLLYDEQNEARRGRLVAVPTLYSGESWDLIQRRWGKLEKDFRLKDGNYDITKIPDIYDCIKFDMHHNKPWINRFVNAKKLFDLARSLANIVVPLEYGITAQEKLAIAQGVATPLLRKIRADLLHVTDFQDDPENMNRLDPRNSGKFVLKQPFSQNVASPNRLVRSRLYFTSESHIHSLVNMLRFGGLIASDDEQWSRAMKYISNVAEFNFLTQIVVMMYEDPTKDVRSDERFHIEIHFSPGMIIGCNNTEPEGPGFRPIGKMGKSETSDSTDITVTKASTVTLVNESSDLLPLARKPTTSIATSMSHLADGWLDNLDSNSTINFPKTRYDRSGYKDGTGVIMNRVFSTAVIKGISSGSSLDKIDDTIDDPDMKCLHVTNVYSLETMHNALSFNQLDAFLRTVTATSKQVSTVTSPVRTPEQNLMDSITERDENFNRFWTHQESLNQDLLNLENHHSQASSTVTSPSIPNRTITTGILVPSVTNMENLQQANFFIEMDETGDERGSSPSSSPRIDSLIFSPVKECSNTVEEPMDTFDGSYARKLDFDLDVKMNEPG